MKTLGCRCEAVFLEGTVGLLSSVTGATATVALPHSWYVYDRHVKNVLEYFHDRPEDLLVIDICAGEGYEKLCPFLGHPIPRNVAFPKKNDFCSPRLR